MIGLLIAVINALKQIRNNKSDKEQRSKSINLNSMRKW